MAAAPQEIQEVIEQAKQAWLDNNGIAFAELFAPSGEFWVPGHRYQGQDQILQAFQEFADASRVEEIEIRNLVTQADQAFVEWSWQEQERATGKVSRTEDAIAIDFQGDRIQRWREYIDAQSPLNQKD